MTLQRINRIIVFTCDECGEQLDTETTEFDEARADLRQANWQTRKEDEEWVHRCPECKL